MPVTFAEANGNASYASTDASINSSVVAVLGAPRLSRFQREYLGALDAGELYPAGPSPYDRALLKAQAASTVAAAQWPEQEVKRRTHRYLSSFEKPVSPPLLKARAHGLSTHHKQGPNPNVLPLPQPWPRPPSPGSVADAAQANLRHARALAGLPPLGFGTGISPDAPAPGMNTSEKFGENVRGYATQPTLASGVTDLSDVRWREALEMPANLRPLPGSVDHPKDLRQPPRLRLGPPVARAPFGAGGRREQHDGAPRSTSTTGSGGALTTATGSAAATATGTAATSGAHPGSPRRSQQQQHEQQQQRRRRRRHRRGESSAFRSEVQRLHDDHANKDGSAEVALERPSWLVDPQRPSAVFASSSGRVATFGDKGGSRYEVTNLQVVAEPWDPSGSMELARLGGTQALASSHWSYGASSQGQSSDEVGAVRGEGDGSLSGGNGGNGAGGGSVGGSFDADVGKDGENDDDDDDAGVIDADVQHARAKRRKAIQARQLADEAASMPSTLEDWLVRHRIESLAPMLKKNFDIIHPDDVLNLIPLDGNTTANNASGSTSRAAGTKTSTGGGGGGKGADKSSTSLEDLIYFVRKAMRPRFQAMVNELKAQAELRRAAEAARGAATSAVQAQRHHHHHHHRHHHHRGLGTHDSYGENAPGDQKDDDSGSEWSSSSAWDSSTSASKSEVDEVSDSDGDSDDEQSKPSPPPSNFSTPASHPSSTPGSSPPQLLASRKAPLTVTPAQGADRKALRKAQKAAQKDTEKRLTRAMSGAFSRATSLSEGSFENGSSGSGDTGSVPHARSPVPATIDESARSEELQKLQPTSGAPLGKTAAESKVPHSSSSSAPVSSTSNALEQQHQQHQKKPASPLSRTRFMPESVPLPMGFPEPSAPLTAPKLSPSMSPLRRSQRPRPRVGPSIVAEVSAASSARLLVMSTPSAIASGRAPSLESSRQKASAFRETLNNSYTHSKHSRSGSRKNVSTGDSSNIMDDDDGYNIDHNHNSSFDRGLGGGGGSSTSIGSLGLPRPLQQGPGACAAFRSSTGRLASNKPPLGLNLEYDLPLHQRAAVVVADASKPSGAFARETRYPLFEAHHCSDLAYGARFVEDRPRAKKT